MVPVAQETTANTVRLPYSFSRRFSLVAWCEASLEILHVHPLSLSVLQELQRGLNAPFTLRQIDEAEFEQRLNAVWQRDSSEARQLMEDLGSAEDFFTLAEELPETEDLLESDDDAPIIKLINAMLAEAIKEGASDIHIETFEKSLVIRFRVDGTLHEMLRPGRKLASLLVSRIKVMARLDIAEKRVPQDGRIALLLGGRAIDVRVSTMPSAWGERVVLRLLDKNQARLTLERLGLSQQLTAQLRQLLHKPHGIFLVTGPTGSGKSTTLYAGLQELNNHSRNILTVEDPIEYMIEGIGQTQVNTRVGMTFARGLRAILRQDPDVVMVGEIRDTETAEIAVQASLTGHLVLSTLHTNTAVGAITRLQDMGVEPFLLSSSLTGVMAQRLVRTLCPDCRQPAPATDEEKRLLGITDARTVTLYHPQGCPACNHKGFRGRTAIHELIVVDATLRDLIHRQAGELELERNGRKTKGMIEADSARHARQLLRGKELIPVHIEARMNTSSGGMLQRRRHAHRRVAAADLALFTRQLATLVQAAMPLETCLQAVSEQSEKLHVKSLGMALRSRIQEGYTLSDSLREHPRVFDSLFCSMVAAGEKSGHLDVVLNRLADYTEQRQRLKSRLLQAMLYPLVLLVVATGVVTILLTAVVPKIIEQFDHLGHALPASTRTLIAMSDALQASGVYWLAGLLGLLVLGQRLLKNPAMRLRWDQTVLRLPVTGRVARGLNTARFSRTLSILTASSVPLLEGIQTAAAVSANRYVEQQLLLAADRVREGSSLRAALAELRLFPPMMLYMIASGEQSGELETMLEQAAVNQEREFDTQVGLALGLFEPALVVMMAGVVLFIVIAILEPMLQLNNMVGM